MDNSNHIFFTSRQISEHIIRLIGVTGEAMYLILGKEKAVLIDTGCGIGDLYQVVSKLTILPVTVILTHGHMDHTMGITGFEQVYMDMTDWELLKEHAKVSYRKEYVLACGCQVTDDDFPPIALDKIRDLSHINSMDLGGITLRIIPTPGHTPGSVSILIEEERILFTGDSANTNVWIFDKGCSSIEEYQRMLIKLQEQMKGQYDQILLSHDPYEASWELIPSLIELCDEIMAGEDDAILQQPGLSMMENVPYMAKEQGEDGKRKDGGLGNMSYNKDNIYEIKKVKNNPKMKGMSRMLEDAVYAERGNEKLKMKLFRPWIDEENDKETVFPAILFVQGSGWTSPDLEHEIPQLARLSQKGFVVATIQHRNATEGHRFPAYLEDVKSAIRFLRKNATYYRIDPERIGIWGTSSGGNAALLAGLTIGDIEYTTLDNCELSDKVNLVVDCFGPADIYGHCYVTKDIGELADLVVDVTGDLESEQGKENARKMSPLFVIEEGKEYPPMLILHGDQDMLVPYEDSKKLYEKLRQFGYEAQMVCVEGAGHEGDFWSEEVLEIIFDFIMENI